MNNTIIAWLYLPKKLIIDNIEIPYEYDSKYKLEIMEKGLLNKIACNILAQFNSLDKIRVQFSKYYKQNIIKITYENNKYNKEELEYISKNINNQYPNFRFRFYIKKLGYNNWNYYKYLKI